MIIRYIFDAYMLSYTLSCKSGRMEKAVEEVGSSSEAFSQMCMAVASESNTGHVPQLRTNSV